MFITLATLLLLAPTTTAITYNAANYIADTPSSTNGKISVYEGEYYLNVPNLEYAFPYSSTLGDVNRGGYIIWSNDINDSLSVHPNNFNAPYTSTAYVLSSIELEKFKYVHVWDEISTNVTTYVINHIRFNLTVNQCENNALVVDLKSTITQSRASQGTVKILNTDCSELALGNELTFNKTSCDIKFNQPTLLFYSYAVTTFISSEKSQMFNVTCIQDLTGIDLQHEISNVMVEIDEIQDVFESAYFTELLIVDQATNNPLQSTYIGHPVKLLVRLTEKFQNEFNIRIDECKLNGNVIYTDKSGPTTNLFQPFIESSEDVLESSFNLFRPETSQQVLQLVYECSVTTCRGTCPPISYGPPPPNRRRRNVIIGKDARDFYYGLVYTLISYK